MRRPLLLAALLCACALALRCAGCGPEGGPDGGPDGGPGDDGGVVPDGGDPALCTAGLTAIAVSPADSTQTVGAAPPSIPFSAAGAFPSGTSDITRRVAWSVSRDDDSPAGAIDGNGAYSPAPGVGGVVTIHADAPCASGTTHLTLDLQTVQQDPGPVTTALFDGTQVTSGAKVPVMVYPSDQTRFPRNIYKVLFQWRTSGNTFFRLTFAGAYSTTVLYTDGAHPLCAGKTPAAGCWEADAQTWQAIAGSNAGGTVTLTLEGITSGDANVYRAPPIILGFSRRDVRGAIFYWSTTSAGVRRATVSDAQPEPYVVAKPTATQLVAPGGTVGCVACHTVSRSGRKMVAYTESTGGKGIYVYDVTLAPPPIPRLTTQISTQKGFGAFSPDDSRLAATNGSLLAEYDSATGAKVANISAKGTNPDWSPTGAEVAYSDQAGDSPKQANLVVAPHQPDGGWGPPRVLVWADGGTNLFPSYTNDGAYLAYVRGNGGHGDVTYQLWLAPADGGTRPTELINANRIVSNTVTNGRYENNMPTWAPPGDVEWIAFNSLRPYGVVYPTGGTQQIWVAAVDRSRLDGGLDPSYPAFRFAFQDLTENNHRAFWAEDVRVPTPDGGVCTASGATCDPVADTCCLGTRCLASSELTYSCQVETTPGGSDAGTCIATGATCSQTSGAPCCGTDVCDVNGTGNYVCQAPQTCLGAGAACTPSDSCCAGMACQDAMSVACSTPTGCTCQYIIGSRGASNP